MYDRNTKVLVDGRTTNDVHDCTELCSTTSVYFSFKCYILDIL